VTPTFDVAAAPLLLIGLFAFAGDRHARLLRSFAIGLVVSLSVADTGHAASELADSISCGSS
jgi:hypothetical protein